MTSVLIINNKKFTENHQTGRYDRSKQLYISTICHCQQKQCTKACEITYLSALNAMDIARALMDSKRLSTDVPPRWS